MPDTLRVLYVDDEPDLLDIGKLFLEESGDFSVVTIDSATAALALLKKEFFHAIISDYQMPGMDGIQFLIEVRTKSGSIPFILFTGKGREEVVIQAINSGADFYLQKGGEPGAQFAELTHKIKQAVSRKRADDAMNKSEAQKLAILNGITTNIAFVDKDLRILWVNKVAAESVKKSPAEMTGYTCYALWADPAGPCENCPTLRAFETKQSEHSIMHTPDGRVWDERGEPVFDENGNLIGVVEIAQDITERKRAEEALRESEETFRVHIENSFDIIFTLDSDGKFIFISPAWERHFGIPVSDVLGKSFVLFVHPDDIAPLIEYLERVLATGQSEASPAYRVRHADGRWLWFVANGTPYVNTKGERQFVGVGRDITERKVVEETLLESKVLIDAVVENVPLMIFLKEATDLRFVVFNRAGEELLGYEREALLGKNNLDLFPPEQAAHFMTKDREVLDAETGVLDIPEESILTAKKGLRLLHTRKVCIRGADGTTKFLLGISEDITERKKLENEMVHQANELRQFSTSLAVANRKLTLLSSITRHDINNQLTVLQGYLNLLEKKQPDPSLSKYFRKVSTAAERISAMIQFTREYEDIGVLAPAWQDCRTLVDTAAKGAPLGQVIANNDLPSGSEIFADPLIVKVFYNLMDNAARYGGKITTIRFYMQESGDEYIIFCEDDGTGVPAEEKEMIFERGFGKNTGLGLALAREILDITGITICETGEPGKGARFGMGVPKGMWRMAGEGD